jgi:hypothetical protein
VHGIDDAKLGQAAVSEELVVTAEAPLIETARTEGATRLNEEVMSDLPNNGRNFLEMTKLTPGVTIVQGPDGDEISINGQKGISNNVSVDGADFNNPFFGEQRGGQRPAFTFNLDAVKEMVVVADGANAEFGRSQSGFVNVITKSGTNDTAGTAHFVLKNDALSSNPKRPDGTEAPNYLWNPEVQEGVRRRLEADGFFKQDPPTPWYVPARKFAQAIFAFSMLFVAIKRCRAAKKPG